MKKQFEVVFMKKIFKRIPWYGYLLGAGCFGIQYGIYRFSELLSRLMDTASYAFLPKISCIDDLIPLVPFFIVIYIYSYLYWVYAPIAVSVTKKSNQINFIIGYVVSLFIGSLIFVFLPSYMDRVDEGLIEQMNKPGFFNYLLGFIYGVDGGERAYNLFPSYHCLISLYCYFGVRKQEEISKGFKITCLVSTILICLSTVFTKQHYIVDIFGGVAISTVVYLVINKINPGQKIIQRRQKALNEKKADQVES